MRQQEVGTPLIARAPELLQMCKSLRDYLEDWWKAYYKSDDDTKVLLEKADRLIREIEGE